MGWTTPRTWVTNELVTAAIMNTHVRDNLIDLRAGGFFAVAPASPDIDTVYSDAIVKAWAAIGHSAGTPSITDDVNVASVTDNGTGDTTVTFATALASANYAAVASIFSATVGANNTVEARISAKATGSVRVLTQDAQTGNAEDSWPFSVICVGG